jgi:hypothetical protein
MDQTPMANIPSYAINVDYKSALLAIANKRKTNSLAFTTRKKTIELRLRSTFTGLKDKQV